MKVLSAFIYPVKSMRAIEVDTLTLDAQGVVGDRRWLVIDHEDRFLTQRQVPSLTHLQPAIRQGGLTIDDGASTLELAVPDTKTAPRRTITIWKDTFDALDAGDEAAQWLSTRLGITCRLVAFADDVRRAVDPLYAKDAQTTFTDGYPLLIVNETSLAALNETLPAPIPMNRFRPNLVVRHETAWAEDQWKKLVIDGVPFDGAKTCGRCVMIATDQSTGEKPLGSEPLTRLNELHGIPGRGAIFGMNLVHRTLGSVRVGAEVLA